MCALPIENRPIVIAITGASGAVFGLRCLQLLRPLGMKLHVMVSKAGYLTMAHEAPDMHAELSNLADITHNVNNVGACTASGSFPTHAMLITPCSIKTMSEIAHGITSNLISRTADVQLKERRPLLLMVRETPLHSGHLENMARLSDRGAFIYPPVPAFYTKPTDLSDLITQTCARALEIVGITVPELKRWS